MLFIFINFILYWAYLFFFFIHSVYWAYHFTRYSLLNNQPELKPSYYLNYKPKYLFFHFILIHTFYRAYLNSFSFLYKVFNFFMGYGFYKKNYTTLLLGLLALLLWLVVRLVTSLPKNIILDSYK